MFVCLFHMMKCPTIVPNSGRELWVECVHISENVNAEPQSQTRGRSKYSTYQNNIKTGRKSSSLMNLCGKLTPPNCQPMLHWSRIILLLLVHCGAAWCFILFLFFHFMLVVGLVVLHLVTDTTIVVYVFLYYVHMLY